MWDLTSKIPSYLQHDLQSKGRCVAVGYFRRPTLAVKYTPEDPKEVTLIIDEETLTIPAKDDKGHGTPVGCNIHSHYVRALEVLQVSGKFGWETKGDALRTAIGLGLMVLAQLEPQIKDDMGALRSLVQQSDYVVSREQLNDEAHERMRKRCQDLVDRKNPHSTLEMERQLNQYVSDMHAVTDLRFRTDGIVRSKQLREHFLGGGYKPSILGGVVKSIVRWWDSASYTAD